MTRDRAPHGRSDASKAKIVAAINDATLPFTMATAVRSRLRRTPEYARALEERRAKAWLDTESLSLGYALAAVITSRLGDLDG